MITALFTLYDFYIIYITLYSHHIILFILYDDVWPSCPSTRYCTTGAVQVIYTDQKIIYNKIAREKVTV
jgi:hypothetical protein